MKDSNSLAHVRGEYTHDLIFISKHRRKAIFSNLWSSTCRILSDLCEQKGTALMKGHAMKACPKVHPGTGTQEPSSR
jgi:REP element-mobilizing transposase RayT